jgi:hypothetical protein
MQLLGHPQAHMRSGHEVEFSRAGNRSPRSVSKCLRPFAEASPQRSSEIILPGALSEGDDFNDQPVPYNFVRPGGRHGSCFAYYYRAGAEFLFMLKKQQTGEYTVYWYALGPVNEQLRSTDDPWLLWVRKMAKK